MTTFKTGDKVRNVDGTTFSNGQRVLTVDRLDRIGCRDVVWLQETETHTDVHCVELVEPGPQEADPELVAIATLAKALEPLNEEEAARVLRYGFERFVDPYL